MKTIMRTPQTFKHGILNWKYLDKEIKPIRTTTKAYIYLT